MKILFWAKSPCIRTWKQAKALRMMGVETMLAYSGRPVEGRYPGLMANEAFDDVITQAEVGKWHDRRIDVVHVAHPPASAVSDVMMLDLPVVYDIHDLESVARQESLLTDTLLKTEREAIERADGLVVVSDTMGEYIRRYNFKAPVVMIPNAGFPGLVRGHASKLSHGDGCLHLVYAAAKPHWGDGHFRDIKWVWEQLKGQYGVKLHVRALMVEPGFGGAGDDGIIRDLSLSLLKGTGPIQLVSELEQYDAGIIPHRGLDERTRVHLDMSSPNKAYEYWQAGIPVLALPALETDRMLRTTGAGITVSDFTNIRGKVKDAREGMWASSEAADMGCYMDALVELYERVLTQNGES